MQHPFVSPPLTKTSPLASLGGWTLTLTCPLCGPKVKGVDEVAHKVGGYREIGSIFSRLTCDRCGAKPTTLTAKLDWIAKFSREIPHIDLSEFLGERKPADPLASVLAS